MAKVGPVREVLMQLPDHLASGTLHAFHGVTKEDLTIRVVRGNF